LQYCFDAATKNTAKGFRLLICDGHDSHITARFIRYCIDHDIVLLCLLPHSSHLMQPLDVRVFGSLKTYMSDELDFTFRNGVSTLQKAEWLDCYQNARKRALTVNNIKAGWHRAGLISLNRVKVLQQLPDWHFNDESDIEISASNAASSPVESTLNPFPKSPFTPTRINVVQLRKRHEQIITASAIRSLTTPERNFLEKVPSVMTRIISDYSIRKRQSEEQAAIIQARKKRLSAKRRALEGHHIYSVEELWEKVNKAEKATERKERKSASRKKKPEKGEAINQQVDVDVTLEQVKNDE